MTLKITKPEINLREKLNELSKPTGVAGEAMLRAQTVSEQQALLGVGRRNLLINGGFDVWQRGTSISNMPIGTYYSADRWHGYSQSTGRTYTLNTTEALSIGFKNCLQAVNGSASPSFYQKIEDVRTAAGKHVTLSFWIKSDYAHSPTPQKISQLFGSGGSGEVAISVPTIKVTTEWTYHTITVQLPSVEGKTIGDGSYILVYPFTLDANRTYWTTGWQLEIGKVATPFEYRSYAEELALCQRYYYRITQSNTRALGVAHKQTSNTVRIAINTPVTMRATPSLVSTGQPIVAVFTWNGTNVVEQSYGSAAGSNGWGVGALDGQTANLYLTNSNYTGVPICTGGNYAYSGVFELQAEL